MSFKIPCGGFKLDEKSFSLDENGVLSVSGGGGGVQSNYNQNDSTAADYIKNRPFYENELLSVMIPDTPFVFYKVSSDVPTIEKEVGAKIAVWTNKQKRESAIAYVSETAYALGGLTALVALTDNAQLNVDNVILTLPERGTYFVKVGDTTTTGISGILSSSEPEIEWNGNTVEIKHIEEKFIPEMTNVLLKSSTLNSAKKFKITVDDSGTIKATEVT